MKHQYSFGQVLSTSTLLVFALSFNAFNIQASEQNAFDGGDFLYTSSHTTIIKNPIAINTLRGLKTVKKIQVKGYAVSASTTVTDPSIKNLQVSNPPLTDPLPSPVNPTTTPTSTPSITITSPNGGEAWTVGSTHTITWNSTGIPADFNGIVSLDLYRDNAPLLAMNVQIPGNPGSYTLTLLNSLVTGSDYRMRVTTCMTGPTDGYMCYGNPYYATDASDQTFTINGVEPNDLAITSIEATSIGLKFQFCNNGPQLNSFPVRIYVDGTSRDFDLADMKTAHYCGAHTWTYGVFAMTPVTGSTHHVAVVVNGNGTISETNLQNNHLEQQVTLPSGVTLPDFIVTDLKIDQRTGDTGKYIYITLRNIGATDPVNGHILSVKVEDLDTGDVYYAGVTEPYPSGWTKEIPTGTMIIPKTSGIYRLKATADNVQIIQEANENNNTFTKTVTINTSSAQCAGPGLQADVYGGPNHVCCDGLVLQGGLCNVPSTTGTAPSTTECLAPYHVLTSDNRCVWSCSEGTQPSNVAPYDCVCKPGLTQTGTDEFGRAICTGNESATSTPPTLPISVHPTPINGKPPSGITTVTDQNVYIQKLLDRIAQLEYRVSDLEKSVIERAQQSETTVNKTLTKNLKGKMLLQVEQNGEVWFIGYDGKKYYLANGDTAYQILSAFGTGITETDFAKLSETTPTAFGKEHVGQIFLRVQSHGEAYYIAPDGTAVYLKDGDAAYQVMKKYSLGATDNTLSQLQTGNLDTSATD